MINAKEYYYVCDEVLDSISSQEKLDGISLTPFGAGDIAGFLVCDDCLGDEPEVEKFFNEVSPNLQEYRFKKRKKLQAWAATQNIKTLPFSEMSNNWFAGQGPKPGDKVNHCDECAESPNVFVLKFDLDPIDVLQLETLKEAGEDVLDHSDAPDFFLLCGACYETLSPDDLLDETEQAIFDDEMQKDLNSKVCSYMDFDTYHHRFMTRDLSAGPAIGDLVIACDHMLDDDVEMPLHYWNIEEAGFEIRVESGRRSKKMVAQWLQCCNGCDTLHSGAEAVLDNDCQGELHVIWTQDDVEDFEIMPPDGEDDTTGY